MTNTKDKAEAILQLMTTLTRSSTEDKQDALLVVAVYLLHKAIAQGNIEYVLRDFSNLIDREGGSLLSQFDRRVEDDSVVAY